MTPPVTQPWFKSWFDSAYYHLLYKERGPGEAQQFIDSIVKVLKPMPGSRFLDVGCGRGRYAVYLNSLGYEVTGIDISESCILHNKPYENESLSFFIHDMRKMFRVNYFDYALNLFTSFGYFDTTREDIAALSAMNKNLKKGGLLVLDYLNVNHARRHIVPFEKKEEGDISFEIHRAVEAGFIVKKIRVTETGKSFCFIEKVKILSRNDFESRFALTGFKTVHLFGSYALEPFDEQTAERLILVAQKV